MVLIALAACGVAAAALGALAKGGGVPVAVPLLPSLRRVATEAAQHASLLGAAAAAAGAVLGSWWVRAALGAYVASFVALLASHRAQTWLIYLHWMRPPTWLQAPSDVGAHGLAGVARAVRAAGRLGGWHLLPAGAPFARGGADFDARLRAPGARVILFFHGNSGTRAFPPRRVRTVSTLAAQFGAHVLTFDYAGFGDSPGRPSEAQLYADARAAYAEVRRRTAPDARVVLYGQSLGSFAAVDLAAHLGRERARDAGDRRSVAVVLESAPASLVSACRSHPTAAPFRVIPGIDALLQRVLKERLDSALKIEQVVFPLLVLHGDCDWMITPDQGRTLYERAIAGGNVDVHLKMFPGCGHNNVSNADDYLETLNQFLERYAPLV